MITQEEITLLQSVIGDRGKLIFGMVCGSVAFNLSMPSSDRDLFGIYLSYETGPFRKVKDSLCKSDPDYAIHEVGKFCEMMAKGNPKVVEPLFCRYCYATPEWDAVHAVKGSILNMNTAKQYVSYASQQYAKAVEGGNDNKHFAHSLRLLSEAKLIYQGLSPRVFWEGEERELLMRIRRGEVSKDEIVVLVQDLKNENTQLETTASLPASLSFDEFSHWIVPLRRQMLLEVDIPPVKSIITSQGSGDVSMKEHVDSFLAESNINGTLLFVAAHGANAYDINTETEDLIAVIFINTDEYYSLSDPVSVIFQNPETTFKKYGKGLVVYEANFFFESIFKGEHIFVELLARMKNKNQKCWLSSTWSNFLTDDSNHNFLSKALVYHYLGVCAGLLARATKDKKNQDWCYYLASRLSIQVERIVIQGNMPDANLPEEDSERLTQIKAGLLDREAVATEIQTRISGLKESIPNDLEDNLENTKDILSSWILGIRKTL